MKHVRVSLNLSLFKVCVFSKDVTQTVADELSIAGQILDGHGLPVAVEVTDVSA